MNASVADIQHARLTEFFTYPGWNKVIEYVGGAVIHIAVTRQSDGLRRWVHSDTAADGKIVGPMDMLALMAGFAIKAMAEQSVDQQGSDAPY